MRFCRFSRRSVRQMSASTQHSSCCQDSRDNGVSAYAGTAALRREHVGAFGSGPADGFRGTSQLRQWRAADTVLCQSRHRSTSALDVADGPAQVQVAVRPVPHMCAELGPDGSGRGVLAVNGDPIRRDAGDRLGRCERAGEGVASASAMLGKAPQPGNWRWLAALSCFSRSIRAAVIHLWRCRSAAVVWRKSFPARRAPREWCETWRRTRR